MGDQRPSPQGVELVSPRGLWQSLLEGKVFGGRKVSQEITPLIAGNWKMNGLGAAVAEVKALGELVATGTPPRATVVICPPATLLAEISRTVATSGLVTGGQDCHPAVSGAHTGDISAVMLRDAGAQYVIVGHSERRTDHGESSALVRSKAEAAMGAGLTPIICVGETEAQRDGGEAVEVVIGQLDASIPDGAGSAGVVVAYEPVWAIGTGRTPTSEEIAEMHAAIRDRLVARFGENGRGIRILYGGSVKPTNARDILVIPDVNGALVGGASLLARDFSIIISSA